MKQVHVCRLVKTGPSDHPVAGQIMGNDPETMAAAAAVLDGMGFDVIDLNFACPVRKVISRKRGGFMMTQPALVLDIIRAVRARIPGKPVTIKLRKAFSAADTEGKDFWAILAGAFDAGVSAACIHARSVDQKYTGRADWNLLARVKKEFPDRTIIGSGDVLSPADALRMIEETSVDGVAAARGAIGNPWFFRQVRDLATGREVRRPDISEQREIISRHFDLACATYGMKRALHIIHNVGIHYARVHPHPSKARQAFYLVKTEEDFRRLLKTWYENPEPLCSEVSL